MIKRMLAGLLIIPGFVAAVSAQVNVTTLVTFSGTNGAQPIGDLIEGRDGYIYGTTYNGGNLALNGGLGYGTVFRVTLDGELTTLAQFAYTNGANPYAGVVQGNDGNFYGTTQLGGTNGNSGTIYSVTTNEVLTPLVYFNVTNGALPYAPLFLSADGNFYGTTASGIPGTNAGTIFKFNPTSGLSTLVSLDDYNTGETPYAGLIQGTNGLLYGTTTTGGYGYGIVFSVTTNGGLSILANFMPPAHFPANPYAAVAFGSDGSIYGTSNLGGSNSEGTIFKLLGGGNWTNVVNFNGTNGAYPLGRLTLASDGNFYGMTQQGGPLQDGNIFELSPAGVITTLATFTHTNGQSPSGTLLQASDGNFYGVTRLGGSNGLGTLFRLGSAISRAPHLFVMDFGGNPVIHWSQSAPDFTLQFASNLFNPNWTAIATPPTLIGNQFFITNSPGNPQGYYRLIH